MAETLISWRLTSLNGIICSGRSHAFGEAGRRDGRYLRAVIETEYDCSDASAEGVNPEHREARHCESVV